MSRVVDALNGNALDSSDTNRDDLEATVERLKKQGRRFRSEIITGNGGKQVLVEDPSGNPIELFQPF